MDKNLSTHPYKGVRDFPPEEQFIQRYIYTLMRETAKSFGFEEYDASILEPAELYESKSSREIIEEQTYTLQDRGGRRVTIRPEMTPTVARMIAKERKVRRFPIRWFSIARVFRYERPQRGRLREHIQLNADLFGLSSFEADVEIIELAEKIIKNAGGAESDFVIYISSRKILEELFDLYAVLPENRAGLTTLLDKKDKLDADDFSEKVREILPERADDFIQTVSETEKTRQMLGNQSEALNQVTKVLEELRKRGVGNVEFNPTLARGFDYYTGVVFEVHDTDPENNRSMFGGGRYDHLLESFGVENTPAVGFGMGDVTLRDFLEKRNLLPVFRSNADLSICRTDSGYAKEIDALANRLRDRDNIAVRVELGDKKISDQIKDADASSIPFIICVGEKEIETSRYNLKHLKTGEEREVAEEEILNTIIGMAKTDESTPRWSVK